MGIIQSIIGRVGGGSDSLWASVVSLLWFNGDLTDQRGKSWSASGGAATSSAQSRFGGSSLRISGGGQQISTSKVSDFDFPQFTQFCIDFWIYVTTRGSLHTLVGVSGGSTTGAIILSMNSSGALVVDQSGIGNVLSAAGNIPLNTWTHVAMSRDAANALRVFIGGVGVTGTVTNADFSSSATSFIVGQSSGSPDFYIDDFRVTKNAARFTTDFTPPTFQAPNS